MASSYLTPSQIFWGTSVHHHRICGPSIFRLYLQPQVDAHLHAHADCRVQLAHHRQDLVLVSSAPTASRLERYTARVKHDLRRIQRQERVLIAYNDVRGRRPELPKSTGGCWERDVVNDEMRPDCSRALGRVMGQGRTKDCDDPRSRGTRASEREMTP
jgi:hypothetical protein